MHNILPQVIKFEVNVILILATASTLEDLCHHRTSNNVSTGEIFRVWCVTLHKSLAVFVDQVATLPSAALGHQRPRPVNSGWMELPHLHILHGVTCSESHADTVAGIDMSIRGRRVYPTGTACRKDCGF